ncbi:MAG: hypothetical protein M1814_005689 [Vezdaea aestivalis]|nr:MAG: hypothetical protein M1814_005689 [Vezdaea aestivalis]
MAQSAPQSVTPWSVSGQVIDGVAQAINYDKLINEFGTKRIDKALLERFKSATGYEPHRLMRRGVVFSHRDLEFILTLHEQRKPFFLYTGRGPSSTSMHLGHAVPFEFTKWLQDVLKVPLVIMLSDDEKKASSNSGLSKKAFRLFARQNAADIIAFGFDLRNTFIFLNSVYKKEPVAMRDVAELISENVTATQLRAIFGLSGDDNGGKWSFPYIQSAASFAWSFPHIFDWKTYDPPFAKLADASLEEKEDALDERLVKNKKGDNSKKTPTGISAIPCLIPCAIDQDPYFRMARDVASKLNVVKPSLLHSIFLPALQGAGSKMSASDASTSITLADTPAQIKKKINKYAFSGGQATVEEQRRLGGNPDVDISFQYLSFFLEDDEELENIRVSYKKGDMLTGELKARCIAVLQAYVQDFQTKRTAVTEEHVRQFEQVRPLEWEVEGHLADLKIV